MLRFVAGTLLANLLVLVEPGNTSVQVMMIVIGTCNFQNLLERPSAAVEAASDLVVCTYSTDVAH